MAVFPHTIGFPTVLSVVFRLFGPSVLTAQLFGVSLSSLSVVLIYLLCEVVNQNRLGFWAAFLWMIMPSRVLYTLTICTENLFNPLAMLAVLAFLRASKSKGTKASLILFALSGFLFAPLSAIRPNSVVLLIACIIAYLLSLEKDRRISVKNVPVFKAAAIAIMVSVLLLTSSVISVGIEKTISRKLATEKAGWNLFVGMNEESNGKWNSADSQLFEQLLVTKGPDSAQKSFLAMGMDRLKEKITKKTLLSFLFNKTIDM